MNTSGDRHPQIIKVLNAMKPDLLEAMGCYLGGGTAVALRTEEYRISAGIDFLCASPSGYAEFRDLIFDGGLDTLFGEEGPPITREITSDPNTIRTAIGVDNTLIKFKTVLENRFKLDYERTSLPVPTLTLESLFTEKLLANDDRGWEHSIYCKDMLDLIMLQHYYGKIPDKALALARQAHGKSVEANFAKVFRKLAEDEAYLNACFEKLEVSQPARQIIRNFLANPGESKPFDD